MTAGQPSLKGHMCLFVRVSNPSTPRSDLVQSFTGVMTTEKKHLTDGAGTFSDVIQIDHAIFSSAVYEWRSAAACLEPAENVLMRFLGGNKAFL